MIDLQQALVADHISQLDDEAAALRAERERDRRSGIDATRVRVGRWLVSLGHVLAGPLAPAPELERPVAAMVADSPCDDGPTPLVRAA